MKPRHLLLAAGTLIILGGGVAVWYFWPPPKFDFDKQGGTILVYEFVAEPEREFALLLDAAQVMAESVQRRLDPNGRGLAGARAAGKDRVEVRVTRINDDHKATVAHAKDVLARVGKLEFRILANEHDDKEGIARAKAMLNNEVDEQMQKELARCQLDGLPPPGPRELAKPTLMPFTVTLFKGAKCTVTYQWVELGPHERRVLNLDNAAQNDVERNKIWLAAKEKRNRATPLEEFGGRNLMSGALFFSRDCMDKNFTDDERRDKAVEYFVLARDPEFETPEAKLRTPMIDGSYLGSAHADQTQGQPVVAFTFNTPGGQLFGKLTRNNVSERDGAEERQVRRHLAILLDGQVLSAPTINSEIRSHGMISGNFSQQEVENMVDILRGGALPGKLKSRPVSETDVGPK